MFALLEDLDAVIRPQLGGPARRPTVQLLSGAGQLNLSTKLGPLDPLCVLHDGQGYEELLAHSEEVTDGGLVLTVIDLPTLIAVKMGAGRAKDKLVVPILMALQKERSGVP